ncbi:MAG: response regulator, partial [Myxococcota bacterium]
MLVEDDVRLAALLTELLERSGHDVAVCGRGDEAPDRIEADQPDLVVLDLTLPGLDGLEVCRKVRARFAGRILVLTARGDESDEIEGLERGA